MRLREQKIESGEEECLTSEEIATHVRLARQGNDASAEALIRFLHPGVSKILNSRLRTTQNREDAAQEIFIRVFKKLDQYSGTVPLNHWVNRIAANVCSTQYRKTKSNKELRLSDLTEEQESYIESVTMRNATDDPIAQFTHCEFLDQLLSTVSNDDQQVIRYVYLQGLSHREVSKLTGWSQSSSKVRAHRAMTRIKKNFQALQNRKPLEFAPSQHQARGPLRTAA